VLTERYGEKEMERLVSQLYGRRGARPYVRHRECPGRVGVDEGKSSMLSGVETQGSACSEFVLGIRNSHRTGVRIERVKKSVLVDK
jgi:hypothetical protein